MAKSSLRWPCMVVGWLERGWNYSRASEESVGYFYELEKAKEKGIVSWLRVPHDGLAWWLGGRRWRRWLERGSNH